MAKRRKSTMLGAQSPHDQMRWSAESMAETAMRSHPKLKQMRDHITSEVMKAGEHAIKKSMGTSMKRMGAKKKGMMDH